MTIDKEGGEGRFYDTRSGETFMTSSFACDISSTVVQLTSKIIPYLTMDLQNTINSFSQTNNGITVFPHKITVPRQSM